MGRKFGGQGRSGIGGGRSVVSLAGVATCLCAMVAIAGCGESSGGKSANAAATTAATTPTAPTTPATTSTAAKPPKSGSSKSSTTTAKSTTTPAKPPPPAAKSSTEPSKPAAKEKTFGKIKVTSTAFKAGGPIAVRYTCDGAGTSPPLQWQGVPGATAEVLVLAVDLSGGSDVVQWAIAGIPPGTTNIPEGSLPAGAVAGVNSAGKVGWGGICGAKGQLHRVGFLFYALKHKLNLRSGFNPLEVRGRLKGATLASGLTLATYQRP